MKNPSTVELCAHLLCDSTARILVLSNSKDIQFLSELHNFILQEWDDRISPTVCKIIELLIEEIKGVDGIKAVAD